MRKAARALGIVVLASACTATPSASDAGRMDAPASHVDGAREMDAPGGSTDAWVCDDWVIWGCPPPPPPPQPAHFTPPTVPCDIDTAVGDPCAHWVDCVPLDVDVDYWWGAWAVTWSGGSCVSGTCAFGAEPTAEFCYGGCSFHTGQFGRCTRLGPTAP